MDTANFSATACQNSQIRYYLGNEEYQRFILALEKLSDVCEMADFNQIHAEILTYDAKNLSVVLTPLSYRREEFDNEEDFKRSLQMSLVSSHLLQESEVVLLGPLENATSLVELFTVRFEKLLDRLYQIYTTSSVIYDDNMGQYQIHYSSEGCNALSEFQAIRNIFTTGVKR